MKLTITSNGARIALHLEADDPAHFREVLDAALGRTEELRLLLLALDGDDDGDDDEGDDDTQPHPDPDDGGAVVDVADRLLSEAGISSG